MRWVRQGRGGAYLNLPAAFERVKQAGGGPPAALLTGRAPRLYHAKVAVSSHAASAAEVPVPDPLDPFEPEDYPPPESIDEEERASLLEDLADLAEFREALESRGFRGVDEEIG